jgi:hypothetical protein
MNVILKKDSQIELIEKLKMGTVKYLIETHNAFKTLEGNDDVYFNDLIKLVNEFEFEYKYENDDIDAIEISI